MVSFDYIVKDVMGLHARPVGVVVKAVAAFKTTKVTIAHNGVLADGKRLFAILGLQVKQGETITVSADGENEQEVLDSILSVFKAENL